jgi:hypothetical protein
LSFYRYNFFAYSPTRPTGRVLGTPKMHASEIFLQLDKEGAGGRLR